MKVNTFFPVLMMIVVIGCAGREPKLGVNSGRLTPCPDSPNCVNSQAQGDDHVIAPLNYSCTREEARLRLLKVIKDTARTRILENDENYIRVAYTSRIFRFVDDVEFYFPQDPVIHVRSASRVGHSDLGANRKRVERIREQFSRPQDG